MRLSRLALAVACLLSLPALAQYTSSAGQNAPSMEVVREVHDGKGRVVGQQRVRQEAPKDHFGNAQGNQHDLAVDGAFEGQTVAVLHSYTEEGFDFSLPRAALKEKGFSVYRWVGRAPSPAELEKALRKACQLWIISDEQRHLNDQHIAVIKKFFDEGHGVYIWGDNQPYYADANAVAQALLGTSMEGDTIGNTVVGLEPLDPAAPKVGVKRRHLLSTGLEYLYEGVTIATLQPAPGLEPLLHGSAGNLVTAFYDQDGKRALLDGGFTRLYIKWDTAGTGRYVKNAAAWLANVERFGSQVTAAAIRPQPPARQ
jgi:hypothetical protein